MNSSATRSLFSLCLGRLNHLLYKPGKLFIRAEVKGGWEVLPRRIFFFLLPPLAKGLRSAKNKQVRAFVQRCNLHINYPAELISTSAYPRYLSTHTCSTLSSHWSKKGEDWQKHGEAEPKGRWGGEALDQNFLFTYSIWRPRSVWMCVCVPVCCSHSRHANGVT